MDKIEIYNELLTIKPHYNIVKYPYNNWTIDETHKKVKLFYNSKERVYYIRKEKKGGNNNVLIF